MDLAQLYKTNEMIKIYSQILAFLQVSSYYVSFRRNVPVVSKSMHLPCINFSYKKITISQGTHPAFERSEKSAEMLILHSEEFAIYFCKRFWNVAMYFGRIASKPVRRRF